MEGESRVEGAGVEPVVAVMTNHDYDVVLFEGDTSLRAVRIYPIVVLVEFFGCLAVIAVGQQVVLFVVGAVFSAQFFVLTLRARKLLGPVSRNQELQTRVSLVLKEVCIQTQCELPRVSLRLTAISVGVTAIRGYVRLIISPDFVAAVDDRALKAILAHEIVHLKLGDVQRSQMRLRLTLVGLYVLWLLAYWKFANGSWIALFGLVVFIVPCLRLISLVASYQNRPREIRADVEGAIAVDDPEGMIRGLQVVYDLSEQIRRRVYPRSAWRWGLFPWSIKTKSHPSLEARIATLTAISVDPGFESN
jgi:Zn-dependent protease with chaperone function